MRAALIALTILLLPAALLAQGTIGIYFTGTGMTYSPAAQFEEFDGYLLLNGFECYANAVEFAVDVPAGLALSGFTIPDGSINLGDPEGGMAISYFPPLNGFGGQTNLLCTLHFLARKACGAPTGIEDAPLAVVPDPLSIPYGVLATCWPDNDAHFLTGLTSIICPMTIAVQSKSWGAIKSLYGN